MIFNYSGMKPPVTESPMLVKGVGAGFLKVGKLAELGGLLSGPIFALGPYPA